MSKAKVHLLQDLLSGEVGVVDQITLGTETMLKSLDISELKRFRPGNVLQDASQCAVYNGLPYQWTGVHPKTIGVESPDLEQGWKSVEYKMNSETALISVISMQIIERGYMFAGTFDAGCVVDSATDAVVDLKTGRWWVYTGALPHTVDPRSLPDRQWTDMTSSRYSGLEYTPNLLINGTVSATAPSGRSGRYYYDGKYINVDVMMTIDPSETTGNLSISLPPVSAIAENAGITGTYSGGGLVNKATGFASAGNVFAPIQVNPVTQEAELWKESGMSRTRVTAADTSGVVLIAASFKYRY